MHFRKQELQGVDLTWIESELQKHIRGGYSKNVDYRDILTPLRQKAVNNSKGIAEKHDLKCPIDYYKTSYSTNMHELIEYINDQKLKKVDRS